MILRRSSTTAIAAALVLSLFSVVGEVGGFLVSTTRSAAKSSASSFVVVSSSASSSSSSSSTTDNSNSLMTIEQATKLLSEWDIYYNRDPSLQQNLNIVDETVGNNAVDDDEFESSMRQQLPTAVRLLNDAATKERDAEQENLMQGGGGGSNDTGGGGFGRCMLGICAPTASEGVQTLKSFTTNLELPRGLLHGMDKDGVPIDLEGGVYIKYNTGGVLTFGDIRKSGMGFDALWKPGDALLEPYDGTYRGVYFQVELSDGEFRQFLVPLDLFDQ